MTKKHFKALAKVIRDEYQVKALDEPRKWRNDALFGVSIGLADYLQTQNPLFDRERFLNACFKEGDK